LFACASLDLTRPQRISRRSPTAWSRGRCLRYIRGFARGGSLSAPVPPDTRRCVITRTSTALLEALKDRSDHAVWWEFDGRYRPLLMAVGRRLGLDVADAEDAAQE